MLKLIDDTNKNSYAEEIKPNFTSYMKQAEEKRKEEEEDFNDLQNSFQNDMSISTNKPFNVSSGEIKDEVRNYYNVVTPAYNYYPYHPQNMLGANFNIYSHNMINYPMMFQHQMLYNNFNHVQPTIQHRNNFYPNSSTILQQNQKQNLKYSSFSLQELVDSSNMFNKDQYGCRLLQQKLVENPDVAPELIKNTLKEAFETTIDPFGNYLIQKLFDYMTKENFYQYFALIQPKIYSICINPHGTRVLQKLVEYLNNSDIIKAFLNIIKPYIKNIILDINGSHIILKLLELKEELIEKVIYDEVKENIVAIAQHKHGCCVLQKIFEKVNKEEEKSLLQSISLNAKDFINDRCANYIIQCVICLLNSEFNEVIVNILCTDLENYSKQKYSSNVVEKCFEKCEQKLCDKLIKEINNNKVIPSLLLDKYGNYVIQKALQRADEDSKKEMLMKMSSQMNKLKNCSFGSKLYNKLIITYPILSQFVLENNY